MFRFARRYSLSEEDVFLNECTGVVHIGANTGQERFIYDKAGLNVLWIEPIPQVYKKLLNNIRFFPKQKALEYLIADIDHEKTSFFVTNNGGESSSMMPLALHKDIWPRVKHEVEITLMTRRYDTVCRDNEINNKEFQALIIDTQGSELRVLAGFGTLLSDFKYIKLEVADFEAYVGCCQLGEVIAYLEERGFFENSRRIFAKHREGGMYYELVFQSRN
jgi:FkbM family methyltransferase